MTHKLKINKAYADAVLSGEKPFEVRRNDRGHQKGDCVEFQVMDGMLKDQFHKLNDKRYKITYVLGSFIGLAPDYVAFAIRDVTEEMKGAE